MESPIRTSFIPRVDTGVARVSPFRSILNTLTVLLFVAVLLGAAGSVGYQWLLTKTVEAKRQELNDTYESFQPSTIRELKRWDARLTSVGGLLDNHIAPSAVFNALERATLSSVSLEDFTYNRDGEDITVTFSGEARSFSSVALQSQSYAETGLFTRLIISNLGISRGIVSFDVEADIEKAKIAYQPLTTAAPAVQTPPPVVATSTPVATTTPQAGRFGSTTPR
jgi:hypothetical protein